MQEKILVIGSKGSMGRRYMALLKHIGVEAIGVDQDDYWPDPEAYTRAIVATPTDTHWSTCRELIDARKPFLVEKPVCKRLKQVTDIAYHCQEAGVDARMVCNWAFVIPGLILAPRTQRIRYGFYNTGKDGPIWDCIQLIYLAEEDELRLDFTSPHFDCEIQGEKITLEHISYSYEWMLRQWLEDPKPLWSLKDAAEATRHTLEFMRIE